MLLKHWENWHPSLPGCNPIIPLINTFLLNSERTNTNNNQTFKRLSSPGHRMILLISINIKHKIIIIIIIILFFLKIKKKITFCITCQQHSFFPENTVQSNILLYTNIEQTLVNSIHWTVEL